MAKAYAAVMATARIWIPTWCQLPSISPRTLLTAALAKTPVRTVERPAHAVNAPHVERVIPIAGRAEHNREVADAAGRQSNDQRRPRRYEPGGRRDGGEAGYCSRHRTRHAGFSRMPPGDE